MTIDHAQNIADLRAELTVRGLAGFIQPLADEHQGEYVPASAQRLAWLTGFTGSAGMAVVLIDKAAVFVDGRYTLQAADQIDQDVFEICHLIDNPPTKWIEDNLGKDHQLGFDAWLHTHDGARRLKTAVDKAGGTLVDAQPNPIDAVWRDQPSPPLSQIVVHEMAYAGKSSADKRADIAGILKADGHDAVVLTAPDSICWLANIRGQDVPYTPLVLAFAILDDGGGLDIFTDRRKLEDDVESRLEDGVHIRERGDFDAGLAALGDAGKLVRLDPASCAEAIFKQLKSAGGRIVSGSDPCQLPKACKNDVELDGMRNAHLRDGAALSRYLAWLDREAIKGGVSEISASDHLEEIRMEDDLIRGLSFPTISGAGPNGAIVHYHAKPETERKLEAGTLYLVDSGAQYLDGTTDVTRTICIGEPTAEMKDRFTRVLKGHIALAMAKFPNGTSGAQLDCLARHSLWQAGLDYDHGTGHGVGSYLGVHEGPQRISKMPNRVALRPGMIVSDEPGYYKANEYGIRTENLLAVIKCASPDNAERELLGFEVLTLAPIDQRLIDLSIMTETETNWLNAYHARVADSLHPLVDDQTAAWLDRATQPISA